MSILKVIVIICGIGIIGAIISKVHTRHFIDMTKKDQEDGNS